MTKDEAKEACKVSNENFDNDLCKPHCPKGIGSKQACLFFFKAMPWCSNIAKQTWEVSKPECMVGYGAK